MYRLFKFANETEVHRIGTKHELDGYLITINDEFIKDNISYFDTLDKYDVAGYINKTYALGTLFLPPKQPDVIQKRTERLKKGIAFCEDGIYTDSKPYDIPFFYQGLWAEPIEPLGIDNSGVPYYDGDTLYFVDSCIVTPDSGLSPNTNTVTNPNSSFQRALFRAPQDAIKHFWENVMTNR